MNYRTYKFLAQTANLTSGTYVHDINMQDSISSILLELLVYNPGVTPLNHPSAALTKIELIDGSDVLYSLDGLQSFAVDWYNNKGRFRNNWNAYMNGSWMTCNIGLNFGRYLWDPEWAFDPKQFNNPQLRISYNCALGGNTSNKIKLTGYAHLFDEKATTLKGFLMSKEIKQYTIGASHEYTDMPLDYPYRNIYLQPLLRGTDPYSCIDNFKLSEDQDKKIPFDQSLYTILSGIQNRYPLVHEYDLVLAKLAGGNAICTPGFSANGIAQRYDLGAPASYFTTYSFDGGRFGLRCSAGNTNAVVHVIGACPNTVVEIPCGLPDIAEDWYDVRRLGSLKADITGLVAGGQAHLSIQQARTY